MKIAICGSMTHSNNMIEIAKELSNLGHKTILPKFVDNYVKLSSPEEKHNESVKNKIKYNLIKRYFDEIKNTDAILVINKEKNSIKNYIGANTLIEMAFAHVLDKKIFLLNEIPELNCKEEIVAMSPVILNGDLTKVR